MYTKQKYYEGGSKHARLLAFELQKQQADNTVHCIKDLATKQPHQDTEEIKFVDYGSSVNDKKNQKKNGSRPKRKRLGA